jgi:hypothetical protein
MKRRKNITTTKSYLVDESFRGTLDEQSNAVVMDNTVHRYANNQTKKKITYKVTQNVALWAGNNTVAVFKIKRRLQHDNVLF